MRIMIAGAGGMVSRFGICRQRSGNRVTLVDGRRTSITHVPMGYLPNLAENKVLSIFQSKNRKEKHLPKKL